MKLLAYDEDHWCVDKDFISSIFYLNYFFFLKDLSQLLALLKKKKNLKTWHFDGKIMQPGSTLLLSLSLNNTTQLPHQIQGNPQIQVSD